MSTASKSVVKLAPVLPAAGVTIRRGHFRWVHKGERGDQVECIFITPIHLCDENTPLPRPRRLKGNFSSCSRCGLKTDEPSKLCHYCQKEVSME